MELGFLQANLTVHCPLCAAAEKSNREPVPWPVRAEGKAGEKFKIPAHSVLGLSAAICLDNMGRKFAQIVLGQY